MAICETSDLRKGSEHVLEDNQEDEQEGDHEGEKEHDDCLCEDESLL